MPVKCSTVQPPQSGYNATCFEIAFSMLLLSKKKRSAGNAIAQTIVRKHINDKIPPPRKQQSLQQKSIHVTSRGRKGRKVSNTHTHIPTPTRRKHYGRQMTWVIYFHIHGIIFQTTIYILGKHMWNWAWESLLHSPLPLQRSILRCDTAFSANLSHICLYLSARLTNGWVLFFPPCFVPTIESRVREKENSESEAQTSETRSCPLQLGKECGIFSV